MRDPITEARQLLRVAFALEPQAILREAATLSHREIELRQSSFSCDRLADLMIDLARTYESDVTIENAKMTVQKAVDAYCAYDLSDQRKNAAGVLCLLNSLPPHKEISRVKSLFHNMPYITHDECRQARVILGNFLGTMKGDNL